MTYDISGGQMDIMAAQVTAPVTAVQRTNPVSLNFTHKLMQVKFAVKCDNTFLSGQKVTNITITGVPTTGKLDIGSGALELSGSGNVTAYDNSTGSEITAAAQELSGGVTIGERTASKTLTLNVTAGGVTYSGITVNLTGTDAGKAGMTHKVTLTFKRNEINATASMEPWKDGGETEGDTERETYPYVMKGRIVVVRDDLATANPAKYPTHSEVWTETPAHSESAWDANASGKNTVAEWFEVASTNASDNGTQTDAEDLCKNYNTPAGTAGQWRVPTIREWVLIWDKRTELTACNLPTTRSLWSATETAGNNARAFYLNCSNGSVYNDNKTSPTIVRCVRDVSRTVPYVVGGNIIASTNGFMKATDYPVRDEKWTETPAHSESAWSVNASGKNTVGLRFEVASSDAVSADGAQTMNWYQAGGTTDATGNPDSYSACASYSQGEGDAGGWRLPTIRELKLLQLKKGEMTGVDVLSNNAYWSTTEYSRNDNAWFLIVSNGVLYNDRTKDNSSNRVRCVRDL